jgi:hypothetical protein
MDMAAYDEETAQLVRNAADTVAYWQEKVAEVKAAAAAARKALKQSEAELLDLIQERASQRGKPGLFDAADDQPAIDPAAPFAAD